MLTKQKKMIKAQDTVIEGQKHLILLEHDRNKQH